MEIEQFLIAGALAVFFAFAHDLIFDEVLDFSSYVTGLLVVISAWAINRTFYNDDP